MVSDLTDLSIPSFPHVSHFWTPGMRKMAKLYGEMIYYHTHLQYNVQEKRTPEEIHQIVCKYLDKSDEFYALVKSYKD